MRLWLETATKRQSFSGRSSTKSQSATASRSAQPGKRLLFCSLIRPTNSLKPTTTIRKMETSHSHAGRKVTSGSSNAKMFAFARACYISKSSCIFPRTLLAALRASSYCIPCKATACSPSYCRRHGTWEHNDRNYNF